ncbi:LysM peptidoglycan-binding domain-containing protein [Lactobacillus equicursoris]|uniref:LysM peptidoglycan-binding domain-containing protein n=1 Tax=Lactobacillus equicursoris TaxID=420645 RepID=A0A844FQF0_9LACO|nr:C40 family peptidase [Lactobacillus equicursoris]MST80443.1 LysM peptidoglycan-binding domain-containing protein [Lactobacillus equicursoris]
MTKNRKLMSALTALSASAALLTTGTSALAASYKVVKNDSLWAISKKYGVSISSLQKANSLSGNTIYVGQTLKIPSSSKTTSFKSTTKTSSKTAAVKATATSSTTYKVAKGDTLWSIAKKYGVSVSALQKANNLSSSLIYIGQSLKLASSLTSYTTNGVTKSTTTSSTTKSTTTKTKSSTSTSKTAVSQAPTSIKRSSTTASSANITAYALTFLGVPYVWGGTTPSGFDCSGYVQYVYNHFGINVGRTTYTQQYAGTKISVASAQAGDLYFWGSYGSAYHVAIALGGGQYVMAPAPGQVVKTGNVSSYTPSFAVRVL